jgi:hypothetical protein
MTFFRNKNTSKVALSPNASFALASVSVRSTGGQKKNMQTGVNTGPHHGYH